MEIAVDYSGPYDRTATVVRRPRRQDYRKWECLLGTGQGVNFKRRWKLYFEREHDANERAFSWVNIDPSTTLGGK